MKVRISELPPGTCYRRGRGIKKKLDGADGGDVEVVVRPNGRVHKKSVKGDPIVEQMPCPLRLLGVGLRKLPEQVVEIGDGNILKGRRP